MNAPKILNVEFKAFIIKILLTLLAGTLPLGILLAQEVGPKRLVMGVPQYLLINGLRIDLDFKLKKPKNWLVISTLLTLNGNFQNNYFDNGETNASSPNENNIIIGGGLQLTFKKFISKTDNAKGFYLALGSTYQYNEIKMFGPYWGNSQQYGLNQLTEVEDFNTTSIHKAGLNFTLGNQIEIINRLYADGYIGFGIRYSTVAWEKGEGAKFNTRTAEYGYTGLLFVAGVRLGVGL